MNTSERMAAGSPIQSTNLIPLPPGQAPYDLTNRGFSPGLDLLFGLVLNRVGDVNRIEVRPPERAGLRPRGCHELLGCYRHCCDTEALDLC